MGDQKRCRRETFDVADVRRSGRLVDQLEPFTCSADLQAVERPPPRRACSKSARMMTCRYGTDTSPATPTTHPPRNASPPRVQRCGPRAASPPRLPRGQVWLRTATGTKAAVWIFRHDRQARRVTLRRFAARDSGGAGQPSREWIGGLLSSPMFIHGRDEPYRPEFVVWMELPDHHVVGHAVVMPEDTEGAVARTLRRALTQPAAGSPRQPDGPAAGSRSVSLAGSSSARR